MWHVTDLPNSLVPLSTGKLPEAFRYCQVLNGKKQFTDSIAWQSCALDTTEVSSSFWWRGGSDILSPLPQIADQT